MTRGDERSPGMSGKWWLAAVLAFAAMPALAQSPNEFVQQTAELLDQQLEGRKEELASNRQALYDLIDEILLPRFDRRYAAQLVLGRHWRSASEEQRQRFIEAFYRAMLRKYAEGVLEFDMSQLRILPYRGDESEERTMVRTTVRLDDGTSVPVDYALIRRDSEWKVFDVRIEGISYVRRFRTEFNNEIQATSLDAVIQRLEREARAPAGEEPEITPGEAGRDTGA
ncbi:MAG TPA: ABC transporter substrate-binding protein [Woeseiaceae bacterium]|nr:ABC transporter substrate-binding protein [Woeseiaceae bacterium]